MNKFNVTVTETFDTMLHDKYPVSTTRQYNSGDTKTCGIIDELLTAYQADELEFNIKIGRKYLNVKAIRKGLNVMA